MFWPCGRLDYHSLFVMCGRVLQQLSTDVVDYSDLEKASLQLGDDVGLYAYQGDLGVYYTRRQVAQYEGDDARDLSEPRLFVQERLSGRAILFLVVRDKGLSLSFRDVGRALQQLSADVADYSDLEEASL